MLILVLTVQSCNDDDPVCGGPCYFDSIPGTALIKQVFGDTISTTGCANAVFVYFDFTPTDSTAPDKYRFPMWPDTNRKLGVGDGKNPPASWVEAQKLLEGTEHPCIRLEEIKGTCPPVIYAFPTVDFSTWADHCEWMK